MFVVRKEQAEAFRQNAAIGFEDGMVAHLRRFTPTHAKALGESGLRGIIRLGVSRAEDYGWTYSGTMRFYIEMMFLFGSDFDSDPQLPWAGKVLGDSSTPDQAMRADRLYGDAMNFIEIVAGPRNVHERSALQRAARVRFEELPAPGGDYDDEVVRQLTGLHPEKCAFVGEAGLRALIPRAAALAAHHAVPPDKGIALLIGLMFTFGHGCTSDQQYPWISDTLTAQPGPDADRRPEQLYRKFMTFLSASLSSVD